MLVAATPPPQEEKQMLGECLFLLIRSMHPNLAGKVTAMPYMLESPEALCSKVDEAGAVLQAHHAKIEATQKVGTITAATSQTRTNQFTSQINSHRNWLKV